ncbi:MAG: type II toxin-antitoxin system VapC family toxin [Terriglobales bacterium]
MITADSSTWIAYIQRNSADDTVALDRGLALKQLVMVPVVLAELFSAPTLTEDEAELLLSVQMLPLKPGYWQRTGTLRSTVLTRGRRAALADTLIAQCCIDHAVPLITRDHDFIAFVEAAGLEAVLA